MKRNIFKILQILVTLLVLVSLVLLVFLSSFLSPVRKANANILLAEGWTSNQVLKLTAEEFKSGRYDKLITTGLQSDDLDFFQMAENGYLIFYPDFSFFKSSETGTHKLEIIAHSEKGGKYSTHFNLYINDSLVADYISDRKLRDFDCTWYGCLPNIDSLTIEFDNDYFDKGGDRNLYIKEIIIDDILHLSYQYNSVFYKGHKIRLKSITNNYRSYAEKAKTILAGYGIDTSIIIAIPGTKRHLHKTLNTALAFRNWADTSEIMISGINIVTQGVHGRRTFVTYRRIIGDGYPIGIISLDYQNSKENYLFGLINTAREVLSLFYYYILLLFY